MFIGDSSPGTSRGECLSPLSVAVSPGALMQFTPAGDNQKCHQRTSREKTEKEVWWQSKIRHQAQWKRQKKKSILWEIWGGGESLGLLKIPILNVSTRFLNQNHKIFEINKQQCLFKRNTKLNHKMPISLEQFWLCQTKATTNYRNTQSSGQPKSKAGKGRLVHSFGGGGAGLTGLQKETEAWQSPMAVPPRSGVMASKLR